MIDPFERWPATAQNPNGFAREPIPEITNYKSYSRVKRFRKSPRHFYWDYVVGNKEKDTDAKREGKLVHKCILETDEFLKRLKVEPSKNDFRTMNKDELLAYAMEKGISVKKTWPKPVLIGAIAEVDPSIRSWLYDCRLADFKDDLKEDDLVVNPDQAERFVEIIRTVSNHPSASKVLSNGYPEVCAYWHDKEFNCIWRVALDYLRFGKSIAWITDVKTSKDASPWGFPCDIDKHAYYIQNWIYKRVVKGITGLETKIVQVVVEKEPPYICEAYEQGSRTEETAYWEIGRLMERWRQCEATNVWPGYTDGRVTPIELPNYAFWRVEQIADDELNEKKR